MLHIDLVVPRTRSLEGTMLAWSPGTKGKPVKAEAIVLPKFRDSTEFVRVLLAGARQRLQSSNGGGLGGVQRMPEIGTMRSSTPSISPSI